MVKIKGCNSILVVVFLVLCWWLDDVVTCPDVCSCDGQLFVYCNHANISDHELSGVLSRMPTGTAYIDLSHNKLRELPDEIFAAFEQMIFLDLSHNEVTSVSRHVFKGLRNLQKIYLHHNQIKVLTNQTFADMGQLEEVYVNNNQISAIDTSALRGMASLTVLDLSHNVLKDVASITFSNLNALTLLDLSNNEIQSVSDFAFSSLVSLKSLHMNHNKLNSMSAAMFSGLAVLTELNMDANHLVELNRHSIDPFRSSIKNFSVSRNKLKSVGSDVFRQAGMLRRLDLSFNEISVIQRGAFGGLSLDRLLLQGNRLTEVTSAMMSSCRKIDYFDLSENDLIKINTHAFDNCRESIYHLNLKLNALSGILEGSFNGMTFLQTLNLANNSINYIEDYAFRDLGDLKTLDLSWNRMSVFTMATISGMKALTQFSLQYNPLIRFEYPESSGKTTHLNIDMNLTATDVTSNSALIRWPFKEGAQIYWSRFVTCMNTQTCAFRPQPEFLAPYEKELRLTKLLPDSVYYICVNPAFKTHSLKIQQCLFIRTNMLIVITTMPLGTPTEGQVSSAAVLHPCAIFNCFQFMILLLLYYVVLCFKR